MITRKDIARHLEFGIRTGFLRGSREYTPLRGAFSDDLPSTGAHEDYADMGDVPWPVANAGLTGDMGTIAGSDGTQVGEIGSGEGITILGGEERAMRIINQDFEITVGITHNAINDNRAGNLEQWARDAGTNFEKHKDYLAFNALNTGEGATYGKSYDGQNFISGSHVDKGAEYTTAQDNQYAVALTLDNYETVRVAGSKFLDSRGQPIGLSHNLLIVPPDLERTAANITNNPNDPDTADRAINPFAARSQLLVAPGGWLDTTAWFLVDTSISQSPLYLQDRQQPQLVTWDDEKAGDGGLRYFKWHARYAAFYGDWRLLIQGQT